jgi:hypothetical protein
MRGGFMRVPWPNDDGPDSPLHRNLFATEYTALDFLLHFLQWELSSSLRSIYEDAIPVG